MDHPNIIAYHKSFYTNDNLCIIMEYADKGDLESVIKTHLKNKTLIEEKKIWNYFIQVCLAVAYIHEKNIIHRDIKSQNVFINKKGQVKFYYLKNKLKLGDFGISKTLDKDIEFTETTVGTPFFLSPEICIGKKYNSKSDIWMLGCLLYQLATLKKPFQGESLMVSIIYKF